MTYSSTTQLSTIQDHLREQALDGWLLYDFRGQNPIALHVAGLERSGTRRWFLWIPTAGTPRWLIHAIEGNTFANVNPNIAGEQRRYVGWRDLNDMLPTLVGADHADRPLCIAMEYSPSGAIPYVSKIDAGIKELVEESTGAEIVSSADLVQYVQAILSPEQVASHQRAAAHCLRIKDEAFAYIADALRANRAITDYDVQQFIVQQFVAVNLDPDHDPIVAVNAAAADPHYSPSGTTRCPIQLGDMVLIDLWARERNSPHDCFADMTWTAYCGSEVPPNVKAVFDVVARSRDVAVNVMQDRLQAGKPVHGYEVDQLAREVIEDAGFGDYVLHRTGHSLGPAVHFTGVNLDDLETQDRRSLVPGVMVTVEPGIYMPDFDFDDSGAAKGLGIRSEVNVYVHENSVAVTTLPLQTAVIALLA